MIFITGMHRSGTSCITGLLNKCGFSLGNSHRLMTEEKFDNPKGHFENLGVVQINETILKGAGGSWYSLPDEERIAIAGDALCEHVIEFDNTFNGDIVKDPRLSVTLDVWKKYSKRIDYTVLCLRNPLGVALSLQKRNNMEISTALELWYQYNLSLINSSEGIPMVVVDYDNFAENIEYEMLSLLKTFGNEITAEKFRELIGDFYSPELNHDDSKDNDLLELPEHISELYGIIKSQTFTARSF